MVNSKIENLFGAYYWIIIFCPLNIWAMTDALRQMMTTSETRRQMINKA